MSISSVSECDCSKIVSVVSVLVSSGCAGARGMFLGAGETGVAGVEMTLSDCFILFIYLFYYYL